MSHMKEDGSTLISRRNAKMLLQERGQPTRLALIATQQCGQVVEASWPDGYRHRFVGFGWGYPGAKSAALIEFAEVIGLGRILTTDFVNQLPLGMAELFRQVYQYGARNPSEWPKWKRG